MFLSRDLFILHLMQNFILIKMTGIYVDVPVFFLILGIKRHTGTCVVWNKGWFRNHSLKVKANVEWLWTSNSKSHTKSHFCSYYLRRLRVILLQSLPLPPNDFWQSPPDENLSGTQKQVSSRVIPFCALTLYQTNSHVIPLILNIVPIFYSLLNCEQVDAYCLF